MGKVEDAGVQQTFCTEDTYADNDNPQYSEVIAETDLIFYKPATDFIVKGKAHAPRGKKAYHLDVKVSAGQMRKTVRVYGNRIAKVKTFGGVSISAPEPFESMELGYKRAYGGVCKDKNGTIVTYFPNPIGMGFTLKGGISEETEVIAVPNLEDPSSPVTSDNLMQAKFEDWPNCPKPASLGWTRRNFYPRYTYAGVLPEYLEIAKKNREEAARKYPQMADVSIPKMDYRAYQGASEGLGKRVLNGGETVMLTYLDPIHPEFEFALPEHKPHMTFDIGMGEKELEPVLQTVVVDKEKNVLTMLWRGIMKYEGVESLANIGKMEYRAQ